MSDLIDRQAAIGALGDMPEGDDDFDTGCRQQWNWDTEAIKALPSAQPEPKKGRWVFKNDLVTVPTGYYECSECKEGRLLYEDNFCPNCGADMRGEHDE